LHEKIHILSPEFREDMIKDAGGDGLVVVVEGVDACIVPDKGNGAHKFH
jgi:hypothetical protein